MAEPADEFCPQLFPELTGSGVAPHGAMLYEYDADSPNPNKFPEYYDGAIFFAEFGRNYLKEIRLDKQTPPSVRPTLNEGSILKINNLLNCGSGGTSPNQPWQCNSPMDFEWHDGELYLLTYGQGFFGQNVAAKLSKFSYTPGN